MDKKCSKCKEVKPLSEFHNNKTYSHDGRRAICKKCHNIKCQEYRMRTKERFEEHYRKHWKEYRNNPVVRERNNKARREYASIKRRTDPVFKLRERVSVSIWSALRRNKGGKDGQSVLQYLPYTIEELKEHLESMWLPGMTWDNYSQWHIDHIIPQSKLLYDSMVHPNFLKCWALENLQPLWAIDNLRKSNKIL